MSHVPVGGQAPAPSDTVARKRGWGWLLLVPGMLWLFVFYLIPTIQLGGASLYDPDDLWETGYSMTFHVGNYWTALQDNWELFLRSFVYAGSATAICLLLGFPLAYAIAFKAGRWKNIMLVLVIAPFFTSFLLRTLSWQAILADRGFVTETLKTLKVIELFQFLHITAGDDRLLATPVAVVAGLVYNFLPFMTLPIYASLDKLDPRLVEAGGDLYASPFQGFRKITWPLALPGVVSGTLLTFIPACGDYVNAELLGTPNQRMIGNRIQQAYLTEHDYPMAATLSIMLMLIVLVMVLFYIRRAGTDDLV